MTAWGNVVTIMTAGGIGVTIVTSKRYCNNYSDQQGAMKDTGHIWEERLARVSNEVLAVHVSTNTVSFSEADDFLYVKTTPMMHLSAQQEEESTPG